MFRVHSLRTSLLRVHVPGKVGGAEAGERPFKELDLNSKGGGSGEGCDGFEEGEVVVVVKEVNDAFSGRWTRTM